MLTPRERLILRERNRPMFFAQPRLRELHSLLLRQGGEEALFERLEPDLDQLIREGQVFRLEVYRLPGERGLCHPNVARAYESEPARFRIATGYGLNQRGVWLQHSWLLDEEDAIHETTHTFDAYFGIIYTDEQARAFCREVPRPERRKR